MSKGKKEEMLAHLMSNSQFVVIDLETTGQSSKKGAEIIEVGAVKVNLDDTKHVQKFSSYVKPKKSKHIPPFIVNLTGIHDEDVENAPYEEIVLKKLYEFVGDSVLVFHNAGFDWTRFLKPGFEKIGIKLANPVICTYILSKWMLPLRGYQGNSFSLQALCEYFGSPIQGAHHAYTDARYTASLLCKLRNIGQSFEAQLVTQIDNSEYSFVDYQDVRILRISPWSKGPEERLYIATNVADVFYDYRRNLWSVQRMKPNQPKSLDMSRWEDFLTKAFQIKDLNEWLDEHHPLAS